MKIKKKKKIVKLEETPETNEPEVINKSQEEDYRRNLDKTIEFFNILLEENEELKNNTVKKFDPTIKKEKIEEKLS